MKKLRFYLSLPDGRCYTVDAQKRVVLVNDIVPLRNPPGGHKETSIGWERDRGLRGLMRNFSTPYSFILDGAAIAREVAYSGNVSTEVYLIIQHLITEVTDIDFAQYYRTIYKGLIDLSTFKDERGRVELNIGESGMRRLFSSLKDTEYKIELAKDSEVVSLRIDGLPLAEKHTFLIGARPEGKINNNFGALVYTAHVAREGEAAGFVVGGSSTTENTPADLDASPNFTFGGLQEITGVRMRGTVKPREASFYNFYLSTNQGRRIDILSNFSGSTDHNYDITFNIAAGERFFLVENNSPLADFSREDGEFTLEFKSRYKTTYIPALMPQTLAKRLIGHMVGDEAVLKDSTLLAANRGRLITSGDGLRVLPGASIKTSITAFIKAFYVLAGASLAFEGERVVIEGYDYFYDFTKPAVDLGAISKPSVDYASDMVGNMLHVGYKEQSFDEKNTNGKLEFNNTSKFTTPVTPVKKTIDLVTEWRTDSYGIENVRINTEGKTTVDEDSDSDIFVLDATEQTVTVTGGLVAHNNAGPTLSFTVALIIPGMPSNEYSIFIPGMKITLGGTALNNKIFTVKSTTFDGFGGSLSEMKFSISVQESVENETAPAAVITAKEWVLNRPPYTLVEGLPAGDQAFNIELSPAHLMENVHKKYINSLMYGFEGQSLVFQTTKRNSAVKVVLNGKTYDEDAPFVVGPERYFIPWVVNFDTSIGLDLADEIEADANRPFSFELEGMRFAGLLQKAAIAPESKKPQSFRLLLGPNEDITKLKK